MLFRYLGVLLVFSLFLGLTWANQSTNVHLDVLDRTPYFDYLVAFDKGFALSLPDFEDVVYVKVIPTDINFAIKGQKIEVFGDKQGTLILKYKGSDFLEGKTSYEKTFDFELLDSSEITLTADINVLKTNPKPDSTNGAYYWKTDKKDFLLHIVLENKQSNASAIIIAIISIAIIAFLTSVYLRRKKQLPKANLLLDSTQNKILARVKRNKVVNQQDLGKEFGLQKSHLTKVLHKMERNNLIERKKVGKINKIILPEIKK